MTGIALIFFTTVPMVLYSELKTKTVLKMIKAQEHLSTEERLRAVILQPREKEAQQFLIKFYRHLMRECKEDRARLFSVMPSEAMGTNWKSGGSI